MKLENPVVRPAHDNSALVASLVGAMAGSPDALMVTDTSGVIRYVNTAFERMTGYLREEAIGRTPRILRSDAHPAEFHRRLWEKLLAGCPFRGEIVNRHSDGSLYREEASIWPLFGPDGGITHFVSLGRYAAAPQA